MLLVYCAARSFWIWPIILCLGIIIDHIPKGVTLNEVAYADEYGWATSDLEPLPDDRESALRVEWYLFWGLIVICVRIGDVMMMMYKHVLFSTLRLVLTCISYLTYAWWYHETLLFASTDIWHIAYVIFYLLLHLTVLMDIIGKALN